MTNLNSGTAWSEQRRALRIAAGNAILAYMNAQACLHAPELALEALVDEVVGIASWIAPSRDELAIQLYRHSRRVKNGDLFEI